MTHFTSFRRAALVLAALTVTTAGCGRAKPPAVALEGGAMRVPAAARQMDPRARPAAPPLAAAGPGQYAARPYAPR